MSGKLEIVPITQKEANAFVKKHHRHHKPVVGSVFQIACAKDDKVVGVVIVGRPVARRLDNGWTLEVNRLCTIGEKNVCSMLYQAAWRVAKNLGYKRLITYILSQENGISLYAAGWKCLGEAGGGNWNVKSRPRVDTQLTQKKILFEAA
jgi:tRNA A37 N6-isopentenylltransferase MiaA